MTDTHCMNGDCKQSWPRSMLHEHFTKVYVNVRLPEAQGNIQFECEKSLLEETLTILNREKVQEKIDEFQFNVTNNMRIVQHMYDLRAALTYNRIESYDSVDSDMNQVMLVLEECKDIEDIYNRAKELIKRKKPEKKNAILNIAINRGEAILNESIQELERMQAGSSAGVLQHIRCMTSQCSGYLMNITDVNNTYRQGTCNSCRTTYCCECQVMLSSGELVLPHKCDPNTVTTMRMIRNTTKPCPNCKSAISRIHGCDQMFCTECHTAFDWQTNRIITGRIHNPHHTEYMQKLEQERKNKKEEEKQEEVKEPLQAFVTLTMQHDWDTNPYTFFEHTNEQQWISYLEGIRPFCKEIQEANGSISVETCHKLWDEHANNITWLNQCFGFMRHILFVTMQEEEIVSTTDPIARHRDLRMMFLRGQYKDQQAYKEHFIKEYREHTKLLEHRTYLDQFIYSMHKCFVTFYLCSQSERSLPSLVSDLSFIMRDHNKKMYQMAVHCQDRWHYQIHGELHKPKDATYFSYQPIAIVKNPLERTYVSIEETLEDNVVLTEAEQRMYSTNVSLQSVHTRLENMYTEYKRSKCKYNWLNKYTQELVDLTLSFYSNEELFTFLVILDKLLSDTLVKHLRIELLLLIQKRFSVLIRHCTKGIAVLHSFAYQIINRDSENIWRDVDEIQELYKLKKLYDQLEACNIETIEPPSEDSILDCMAETLEANLDDYLMGSDDQGSLGIEDIDYLYKIATVGRKTSSLLTRRIHFRYEDKVHTLRYPVCLTPFIDSLHRQPFVKQKNLNSSCHEALKAWLCPAFTVDIKDMISFNGETIHFIDLIWLRIAYQFQNDMFSFRKEHFEEACKLTQLLLLDQNKKNEFTDSKEFRTLNDVTSETVIYTHQHVIIHNISDECNKLICEFIYRALLFVGVQAQENNVLTTLMQGLALCFPETTVNGRSKEEPLTTIRYGKYISQHLLARLKQCKKELNITTVSREQLDEETETI